MVSGEGGVRGKGGGGESEGGRSQRGAEGGGRGVVERQREGRRSPREAGGREEGSLGGREGFPLLARVDQVASGDVSGAFHAIFGSSADQVVVRVDMLFGSSFGLG